MKVQWLVVKWELRKWIGSVGGLFVALLAAWALLLVIPVPAGHWSAWIRGLVFPFVVAMSLYPMAMAMYMLMVYPFFAAFGEMNKSSMMEHQTARPFARKLCTRLALNLMTYALGIGVLWVTMLILRRYEVAIEAEWFHSMITDSPLVLFELMYLFALAIPLAMLNIVAICDFSSFGWKRNMEVSLKATKTRFIDVVEAFSLLMLVFFTANAQRILGWLPPAPAIIVEAAITFALTAVVVAFFSRLFDRRGAMAT